MKTDETPTCQNCGKSIEGKRLGTKFCSTSCRVSSNNKKKRKLEAQKEQERQEAKKNLPDWILWIIRKRKVLIVYAVLILIIIFQTIGIVRLFQENKELQQQTTETNRLEISDEENTIN